MEAAMGLVKRFAFWPLLAIVSMTVASAVSNPDHGSAMGTLVGLVVSLPIAIVIDRRRQRRWNVG
jgi:hypothetical protein